MDGSIALSDSNTHKGVITLPNEIVHRILNRLSFSTMVVAKAVCKQWNTTISSPEYLQSMAQMHSSQPWFLMFFKKTEEPLAYDPATNSWQSLRLPEPPADINHMCIDPHLRLPSSMWGFLAFNMETCKFHIMFCNPLAKVPWIQLPMPLLNRMSYIVPSVYSIAFVTDHSPASAASIRMRTVVMIWYIPTSSDRPLHLYIEVYQSEPIAAWKETEQATLPDWSRIENSVFCNGILYCTIAGEGTSSDTGNGLVEKHGVFVYNLSDSSLTQLSAPMPCSFTKMVLLNCNARLIMVGGIHKSKGKTKGIGLWEFNEGMEEWVEVGTMPERYFKKIGTKNKFNACGSGELIYFHNIERSPLRLLLFNVPQRRWRWTKRLPRTTNPPNHILSFSFEPTL